MLETIKIDGDLQDVLNDIYKDITSKKLKGLDNPNQSVTDEVVQQQTGVEYLRENLHRPVQHDRGVLAGDLSVYNIAQTTWTSDDPTTYDPHNASYTRRLVKQVVKIAGRGTIVPTAQHLLKAPRCVMGWHTNITGPGKRVYMVHADESNKSYFKYFCSKTQEPVKCDDKKGWQVRMFDINEEDPLWHCVYSECNRISLGFRIIYNL